MMHQDEQRGRHNPTARIKAVPIDNQSRPSSFRAVNVFLDEQKERNADNSNQCYFSSSSSQSREGGSIRKTTTVRKRQSRWLCCQSPVIFAHNHHRARHNGSSSSRPSVANWASRSLVLVFLFAYIGCLLIWLAAATRVSGQDAVSGNQIDPSSSSSSKEVAATAAANLVNQANSHHHPHHRRHHKRMIREQIARPSKAEPEALLNHHRRQIEENEVSTNNDELNDDVSIESKHKLTQISHSTHNKPNHNIKSIKSSQTSRSVSNPTTIAQQQLNQRSIQQVPEQVPIVVSSSDNSYVSASPFEQQQQQETTTTTIAPPSINSRSTSSNRYTHRTSYPHHQQQHHLQTGNKRGQPELISRNNNRETTDTIRKYSSNRAISNSRRSAVSHITNANHQKHSIQQKSSQKSPLTSRSIAAERHKFRHVQTQRHQLTGSQSREEHPTHRRQLSSLLSSQLNAPVRNYNNYLNGRPNVIPKSHINSLKHHHDGDEDDDHDDGHDDDDDDDDDHDDDRDRDGDIDIDIDHDDDGDDFEDDDHDDDDDDIDDDEDNDVDVEVDVDVDNDDDLDADDGYDLDDESGLYLASRAQRRKSRRLQRFGDRLHLGRDLRKFFRHISSNSNESTKLVETTTANATTLPAANQTRPSDNETEETLHGFSWSDNSNVAKSDDVRANDVRLVGEIERNNKLADGQQQQARNPGQSGKPADVDDDDDDDESSKDPLRRGTSSRSNIRIWSISKGSIGSINSDNNNNNNNLNSINNPSFGVFEASSAESVKGESLLSSGDSRSPRVTLFNSNDGDDDSTTRWSHTNHKQNHHNHHHQLEGPSTPPISATNNNLRKSSIDVYSHVPHYSKIVAGPSNHYSFDGRRQWHDSHIASISIGQEEFSEYGKGGINSAIIAIIFGVGATGMLIVIVGHKMRSIRERIAIKGQRRSLVPDADFLINTIPI